MIKLGVVLAVLLFMVMMGMSNQDKVIFRLNPLGYKSNEVSTAILYFLFFSGGVVMGAFLAIGGAGKPSSKGKS